MDTFVPQVVHGVRHHLMEKNANESLWRRNVSQLVCRVDKGHVKPDIVFFGEGLPERFHRLIKRDVRDADLLIVMGTSLMVAPVCEIPNMVRRDCPRILFNRELVGNFCSRGGMKSRRKLYDNSERDIFHEGDCDDSVRLLCSLLGWEEELNELNSSTRLG